MRQLFLDKGMLAVKQACQPLLDTDSVLVSVHYSAISSGTEIAAISKTLAHKTWTSIPQKISQILASIAEHGLDGTTKLLKDSLEQETKSIGFSCSGQVIAVGKQVRYLRPGDFVACASAGMAHHTDVIAVPENVVVKLSDERFVQTASITTMGAIALQALRRSQLQIGETVCIFGLGIVGLLAVQLGKRAGFNVIAIDLIPERLALAKKLGADKVCHAANEDIVHDIYLATDNYGADCTIVTAESQENKIIQQAMELTRKKGKVVLVGNVGLALERNPFFQKEVDFLVSSTYGPGRCDPAHEKVAYDYPYAYIRWTENRNMQAFVQLLQKGEINVLDLEPHITTIDQAEAIYASIQEKKTPVAILSYLPKERHNESQEHQSKHQERFVPAKKDTLRVGFVGLGGFVQTKLLPLVQQMKQVSIDAIVDPHITKSLDVVKTCSGARLCNRDYELFSNDVVDAVIIASPHQFHAEQALRALKQNKAVFVEKPMVTTFEQLEEFKSFLNANPESRFCVDYNRSFAPLTLCIQDALRERKTPIMAHYRFNAGVLPKDHWIQTEHGAGRIIGDACQVIDLFCTLTEAKPLAVSVESISGSKDGIFPTDNFSAHISFSDGSVCSLLYTSLGSLKLPQERLELFFDGKAIVMEEYQYLQGFGLARSFNRQLDKPDYGHATLIEQFFTSVQHGPYVAPITTQRLFDVASLTLTIDALVCQGGGQQEYTQEHYDPGAEIAHSDPHL